MENKQNDSTFLLCTYLLLLSHPIYRCIYFLLNFFGINVPYLLEIIYLAIILLAIKGLIKHKLYKQSILILLITWGFFGINFLISTDAARQYYGSSDVQMMLILTIPITALIVTRVDDWEKLFSTTSFLLFSDIIVLLSFLGKLLEFDNTNYMSFSYDLLPVWGIIFIAAFCYKKRIQWIFLGIGLLEGLIYGARGPLLWLIILFISTWFIILYQEKGNIKYLVYMLIAIILSYLVIQIIIPLIIQSQFAETSYIINRLGVGSLTDDSGRQSIYIQCKQVLKNMGLNVYGLYYDRTVLREGVYAHNIFYEVLISFGWLVGSIFILGLFIYIIKRLFYSSGMRRVICIFFICTMFLRYFISGSIFDESAFVIFIGAISSLKYNNPRKGEDINERNNS